MKKLLAILFATALLTAAGAQETDLPRYTGFAVGAHFLNQYAVGDWADYAKANIGGGISAEYTIPLELPANLDLGASVRAEAAHTLLKSDSPLESDNELRFGAGVWLRVPFALAGQAFAFQPEVAYLYDLHHAEGKDGAKTDGWYGDSTLSIALALRYTLPPLTNLEVELAPLYTVALEKEGNSVHNLGFRLGAVWHINKAE